jgi:peptide/nickel transport system substrate-binding protein
MSRLQIALAFAASGALALGVLGLASARTRAEGRYGGVLTIGLAGNPSSLDPTLSGGFVALEVYRSICERLYDFDAESRVYPELAAALPVVSADKLTYTIPLRQGVVFNDGTPLNAQAVVTSLQRMISLPGSSRASDFGPVDSVTAPSTYVVVIHLSSPYTPLLQILATNDSIVMSPTQLAKLGDDFGQDPVCVGPFMFDHSVAGDSVTVIKSPYYYDKYAVHLDKIVFKTETDPSAAVAALESGDVQVLDSVPLPLLPSVEQRADVHVIKGGGHSWSGIHINIGNKNGVGNLPYTNVGTPLASSPMLRQAFEEAIDRTALVKVVYAGLATPGCTPIGPASPLYDPTVKCTPFDPQDAKALVAKSGLRNPTVHLAAASADTVLAQFIQAEEGAVGIKVVIDPVEPNQAASGNFDTVLVVRVGGTPDVDRGIYWYVATDGSRNSSGYSNPRLDLILANTRKATSPKALKTLYHAADEILIADRPIIVLCHNTAYAAVSTSVSGVQFYGDGQVRANSAEYRSP